MFSCSSSGCFHTMLLVMLFVFQRSQRAIGVRGAAPIGSLWSYRIVDWELAVLYIIVTWFGLDFTTGVVMRCVLCVVCLLSFVGCALKLTLNKIQDEDDAEEKSNQWILFV